MHKVISAVDQDGVLIEVVDLPELVFAGKMAYADNYTDEPDIDSLLKTIRSENTLDKVIGQTDPEWTGAVSIDYWQGGAAKRGFIFAKETSIKNQPEGVDTYLNPASLYVRVKYDKDDRDIWKLLGEEQRQHQPWVMFGYLGKKWAVQNGYEFATHGAQEFEYYGPGHICYVYAPIAVKEAR